MLVKDKSAEQILATPNYDFTGPVGEYLRVAAQVRANQELVSALTEASKGSDRLQRRVLSLTIVIAMAAIAQAVAAILSLFHNG